MANPQSVLTLPTAGHEVRTPYVVGNISYTISPCWGVTFREISTGKEELLPLLNGYSVITLFHGNNEKKIALKNGESIITIDQYLSKLCTAEAHNELSKNPNWQDNFHSWNPTKASPALPTCFQDFKSNFPRDFFATDANIQASISHEKLVNI